MRTLRLLFHMRGLWTVLAMVALAGCTTSDTPEPQEELPPPSENGDVHHIWYNLTEPGNFSVRFEMTLEKPEGGCEVDSALMGTATDHNIHHMLFLEQNGGFSGLMVGFSEGAETYVQAGDGEAIAMGGEGGSDWSTVMHLSHPMRETSYAVTLYGFNAASMDDEGPALHIYCEQPMHNVTALWSDDPGAISFYPEDNTVRTEPGSATWSRSHPFTAEGQEVHMHWLADSFYGQWAINGPGVAYERTLTGSPSHSHREGSAGDYLLEVPLLMSSGDNILAFVYAGLEATTSDSYDLG